MATTTATVSISSSDLTGSPLSINASSTLMAAGLTTGLKTGFGIGVIIVEGKTVGILIRKDGL